MRRRYRSLFSGMVLAAAAAAPALADKIKHPVAIFAGLDKITGRIISFEVSIDETVQFGSLHVTPRVCFTRPATEAPHTTGFVEVEEVEKENQFKKIFTGWMFAASPGLSAAEHPVYDVWLTDCKGGSEVIKEARAVEETPPDTGRPVTSQPATAAPSARPPRAARQSRDPSLPGGALPPAGAQQPGGFPPAAAPQQRAPLPAAQATRPSGFPLPPGNIPQGRAQEQRRAPSQSFFPTGPAASPPSRDTGF